LGHWTVLTGGLNTEVGQQEQQIE